MKDWNNLILGEEDSQTAPVYNGTVREMIADIDRLKGELEDAKKEAVAWANEGVSLERQLASARKEAARECLLLFYLALDESISYRGWHISLVRR